MKYILINAASVAGHNPGKFWHPSRSILARLRRSAEVQLRIVAYDEKESADLWDNDAIWVRLTRVGPQECVGTITTSAVDAAGFRVGNKIRFSKDRIFDVWELGTKGELLPNRGKARFIRGKDVIVGLTYLKSDGSLSERMQFHGTIEIANTTTEQFHIGQLEGGMQYPAFYDPNSPWEIEAENFVNEWWANR